MQTLSPAHAMQVALQNAFPDATITVTDDSAKHHGHAGARPEGATHFSVQVISHDFTGMPPVARHRAVYGVLQDRFTKGLHALAIQAKTPLEMPPE